MAERNKPNSVGSLGDVAMFALELAGKYLLFSFVSFFKIIFLKSFFFGGCLFCSSIFIIIIIVLFGCCFSVFFWCLEFVVVFLSVLWCLWGVSFGMCLKRGVWVRCVPRGLSENDF